jgi:hypothetical protein
MDLNSILSLINDNEALNIFAEGIGEKSKHFVIKDKNDNVLLLSGNKRVFATKGAARRILNTNIVSKIHNSKWLDFKVLESKYPKSYVDIIFNIKTEFENDNIILSRYNIKLLVDKLLELKLFKIEEINLI